MMATLGLLQYIQTTVKLFKQASKDFIVHLPESLSEKYAIFTIIVYFFEIITI